ncbi:MAG: translesion error-prone DNA polymerase V autoproteolytic subunit [Comamonas sp.]|jgi:DNA polymerase V
MYSNRLLAGMPVPITASPMSLPLLDCVVRAGNPSPAQDFSGKQLDISAMLVDHPQATYFLRVAGPSMQEYGMVDGDLIVVDRAIPARHGHIVVAIVDSEFTVKYLHQAGGDTLLKAGNPTCPDITLRGEHTIEIWGVVTSCIKRFSK